MIRRKTVKESTEYYSLCTTQYELSSKENEKRLDSAITKLKGGASFAKDLIEE